MKKVIPASWLLKLLVVTVSLTLVAAQGCARKIERDKLIEDARYLASVIEEVHPDPYLGGGGKVAFHRRLHELIRDIPADGMNKMDFYFHIRPFVAAVGDAHTWLNGPQMTIWAMPGGVPLFFWVVERSLYVRGIFRDEHRPLLGCRLVAIEGVPYEEIINRGKQVICHDNYFQILRNLAGFGQLFQGAYLRRLLPEWTSKTTIRVTLEHPDGGIHDHDLKSSEAVGYPPKFTETSIELPSTKNCDFVYDFIGDDRETVILVISGMMRYREALEMWRSYGSTEVDRGAREAYKKYHGKKPPGELDEVIAGVPAATEVFRDLVKEMKESGTRNLIIDLRQNEGGNSYMSQILVYFLYGREGLAETMERGSEVIRYSQAYFDRYEDVDLEQINEDRDIPLQIGDYDFKYDHFFSGAPTDEIKFVNFEEMVARMPTFEAEYGDGTYCGWYKPEKILVVTSHNTFSAGYTLLRYLYMAGAEVVGTPSAQAGNCFGDILNFELTNSGLGFTVSRKAYVLFPDDPEKGRVLMPDHLLTYEKLKDFDFDNNAAVIYALDLVGE